jgi:phage-related protein
MAHGATRPLIVEMHAAFHLANRSYLTYTPMAHTEDKPLVWLHSEVKSPPFSPAGRIEAGYLLRELQLGNLLTFPASRPMPEVGVRCHELRIGDAIGTWRVVCRLDPDAIVIVTVFRKTTQKTPLAIIRSCRQRLHRYDRSRSTEQ